MAQIVLLKCQEDMVVSASDIALTSLRCLSCRHLKHVLFQRHLLWRMALIRVLNGKEIGLWRPVTYKLHYTNMVTWLYHSLRHLHVHVSCRTSLIGNHMYNPPVLLSSCPQILLSSSLSLLDLWDLSTIHRVRWWRSSIQKQNGSTIFNEAVPRGNL